MSDVKDRLEQARAQYGSMMAAASGSEDPRIGQVFEALPRENFLPPGPWRMLADHRPLRTHDADPVHLYRNALVSIDAERGINNGEPMLHAAWIGAVAPKPGETVVHIGAGGGYYTAALAMLVDPGKVIAYEIVGDIAAMAERNLAPYPNVTVVHGDAVTTTLEPADIIYVNAGVIAPPGGWLKSLKPGGRLIFPWRPTDGIGLAILVERGESGFPVTIVGGSWFIPCVGASDRAVCVKSPARHEAHRSRSIVLTADRKADSTATAIYRDVWFSSENVA